MPAPASDQRRTIINALAVIVTSLKLAHPTRVAVEGRSAAGKTTFADELAAVVRTHGCDVLRASIDAFHPPGYKLRSLLGR